MMPTPANRNYAFSQAFVEELAQSGLHHTCICPGSRSTPLAMSLAQEPRIKTWIHLDERSAAYFALGVSRSLSEPVAVISTSGTAAANFYPAVIEAHYSHIPLLIVTADRPPELWEWGANQTIDQTRIYGNHVKWSVTVAPPEVTVDLLKYVRELTCRVFATATQSPAGPVHVNFPFTEPLVPKYVPADIPEPFRSDPLAWKERASNIPYTQVNNGTRRINPEKAGLLARELQDVTRGIIVCGPQYDLAFPNAIAQLAKRLGYPILADPLSQVRCGQHDRAFVVDTYDAFLRSREVGRALRPRLMLRFGATPTSKVLQSYISQYHDVRQILIHDEDWQDPMHTATDLIQAEARQFVEDLVGVTEPISDTRWAAEWLEVDRAAQETIRSQLSGVSEIFEGQVFAELASILPSAATLFAGNSMPVRDLDSFFPASSKQIRFMANRGASGIDGIVSTAVGIGSVSRQPTVLVVGDLSFYHDMNGLFAAKQYRPNVTIIILNNDGGGIFSFLPQREFPDSFEKYFATPHGLTFQAAASLYGLTYSRPNSWESFRGCVARSIASSGTTLVEVQTNRDRNLELHRQIWSAVDATAQETLARRT